MSGLAGIYDMQANLELCVRRALDRQPLKDPISARKVINTAEFLRAIKGEPRPNAPKLSLLA